jgi:hypothetical protein
MAFTKFMCALALAVAMVAAACPEAAADRLEVSIGGRAVHQGVQKIEVTATDLDTGQEGPPATAIVTLGRSAAVRIGDPLVVNAHGGPAGAVTIFKGEIVGIEPVFETGGSTRVVVRAFNRLHRLTRGRKSRTFDKQRDSDIVSAIAKENGLAAEPQVEVDIAYDHVYQHNQTDLEFLLERAKRIGYEILVDDSTLLFRRRVDPPVLTLGCGGVGDTRLRAFHPRLSSAQQVTKVTVRGWNPDKKEEIVGVASARRLVPSRGAVAGGGKEVELGDWQMLSTASQSYAVARAMLEELTSDEIAGEAATDGDPRLMPGARVQIDARILPALAGELEVVAALHRHAVGGGGYITLLKFRRADRAILVLPEVGDEVLVAFEHGDIARPVVVGSLWNGQDRVFSTACDRR